MLLDQVGTSFKLRAKPVTGSNSFLHALDHFTTLALRSTMSMFGSMASA